MGDNDLYLQYVEQINEQLNSQKVKSRDELQNYFEEIKQDYINNLENALEEIFEDYCTENNLEWDEEDELINKEEIEEIKRLLFQGRLTQYGKRKLVNYLEQKESILDKVTDKLKEDIEIDKVEWYEDGKMIEKQSKAKNVNRKEYAREILDIIDGGVKK